MTTRKTIVLLLATAVTAMSTPALAEKPSQAAAKRAREVEATRIRNPLSNPHPWWAIINFSPYGAAAMEYHDDAQTLSIFAPAVQLGLRYRGLRFGISSKWFHTWDSENLFDVGGFISGDVFSAEQDRHRSFGAYLKLDVGARWAPDRNSELALVLEGSVGLRILGLYAEAGMGPVIGPLGIPDPLGFTMEGRIGFELVEFISLFKAGYFGG